MAWVNSDQVSIATWHLPGMSRPDLPILPLRQDVLLSTGLKQLEIWVMHGVGHWHHWYILTD